MNSELGKQEQGKRGFLEVISKLSSEEKNKLTGMCVGANARDRRG